MEAIIISGMPACGKTTLAKILAQKLRIQAIGAGDILKEMAKERGYRVTGNEWWDTSEGMKFLEERQTNPNFDKETDNRMMKRINKGNVVVTSYTMPWLSKKGFKIWIEASPENRAKRMVNRDNSNLAEAVKAVRKRDRENTKLYNTLYGIRFGKDLSPFDLVVNTNGITASQAAKKVLARIKELKL